MRQTLHLKDRVFGRLTVIDRVAGNPNFVVCRCECGTICTVRVSNLTKAVKPTRSCGCLRRETSREIGKRTLAMNTVHRDGMNKRFGTLFHMIENPKLHKNNTTGHRGVCQDKKTGKYKASIGLHRKLYNLGTYKTLDEAIAARLDAEDKMYAPLIAEKNALLAARANQ